MKRSMVLLAVLCACADPTTEVPPDAGDAADGAPWSHPDIDPPAGPAVTLEPVLDINTQPPPIGANSFLAHGGKVYFGARHAGGGYALFATDGTAAGTAEVASRTTWTAAPRPVLSANGQLYVVMSDEVLGNELWISDGTDAGTRLLVDAWPGIGTGFSRMIGASSSTVYWVAVTARGVRLWCSDGTPAGSHAIGDYTVYATAGGTSAAVVGSKLYFGSADGPAGAELYVTDGTIAGTHLVKDLDPGTEGSWPATFAVLGTKLVFSADDGAHGAELWVTDGSAAGTTLIRDIQPGAPGAIDPINYAAFVHQGVAYVAADDGTHGRELWRTDGTAAGTTLVSDLWAGTGSSAPRAVASLGTKVLVFATDSTHGREPFISDGTAAGTSLIADIGLTGAGAAVAGGKAYFTANDGTHGNELWRTDGTAAGTALVVDLLPGTGNGVTNGMVGAGDRVYFPGTDPMAESAPFTSDGTTTYALIPSSEPGASAPSTPGPFVVAGDKLFFAATDAAHGRELWVRDASGTHLVRDVNPGALAGINGDPTAFGASVAFIGIDPTHGNELWVSDGTEAGTHLVKDLNPGTATGASAGKKMMVAFNGKLYFFGNDGSPVGQELYVTDGSAAGTALVADLDPTPSNGGFAPRALGVYDGMLLFNGRDADDFGLFRLVPNGNVITRLTTRGQYAEALEVAGGKIVVSVFGAPAASNGLYVTNGTAAGTTKIGTQRARQLFGLGSTIAYFVNGQLFRNDGALGSSVAVSDAGPPDSLGTDVDQRPVELAGALYFVGGNGSDGFGLWRSDLTAGGTRLVRALSAGTTYFTGVAPVRLGDIMYFAAGDGATGTEVWMSDGTTAGTRLVRDVCAGPRSSAPHALTAFGGALYLSLDDGAHGVEPWRLTVP